MGIVFPMVGLCELGQDPPLEGMPVVIFFFFGDLPVVIFEHCFAIFSIEG